MYPYTPEKASPTQATGLEYVFDLANELAGAVTMGLLFAIDRMRTSQVKARERLLVGGAHDVGLLSPGVVSRPAQIGQFSESSIYLSQAEADCLLLADFERQAGTTY